MNVNKPISQRMNESWSKFVMDYDLGALPAFLIFFIVVTLGVVVNFIAMRHAIGDGPAALVSGLFEIGILFWKWTGNRKKNNDTQRQIVETAVWLSVFLAVGMLIINLFRTAIERAASVEVTPGATFNGWEIAAYSTIGIAALVHIVCYLLFDGNDTDKEYSRENKRKENDIAQRSRRADDTVRNAEADLKIIEKITIDLNKLRGVYQSLPSQQLEIVLEKARQELLSQYNASPLVEAATASLPDINQDKKIGDQPMREYSPTDDGTLQSRPSNGRRDPITMGPTHPPRV